MLYRQKIKQKITTKKFIEKKKKWRIRKSVQHARKSARFDLFIVHVAISATWDRRQVLQ